MVDRIPARYHAAVVAHVMVEDASEAITFYERALGAEELFRVQAPDGSIVHAEVFVQGSIFMVGDAADPFLGPRHAGGTTVGLHVYVDDVDAAMLRAAAAGATVLQSVQDMFYGDRVGMIEDPFGHVWVLLTHREELAPKEIARRGEAVLRTASAGRSDEEHGGL